MCQPIGGIEIKFQKITVLTLPVFGRVLQIQKLLVISGYELKIFHVEILQQKIKRIVTSWQAISSLRPIHNYHF
jgi:hypothetical protein